MDKQVCIPDNALKFADWISNRGGVAIWQSANLSNPGASWSTPALTPNGLPTAKPTWQAEDKPSRIITSPDDILVSIDKEVKRFRVAIRHGSQGFSSECTDASSRKIKQALSKAGNGSYHLFDYETQEAVIMIPESQCTLTKWLEDNKYNG
jgi:hypothetical protein